MKRANLKSNILLLIVVKMNFQFWLSLITTVSFVIAVSVAIYAPDEVANGRDAYTSATAVFAIIGCVSSAVLTFSLFSGRNNLLDRLKSA